MKKICSLAEFAEYRNIYKKEGRKVVWTNGCFDLLHAGHLQSLTMAKDFGDVLVVGLNADKSVTSLKTPDRPFVNEDNRATLLAGLEAVDHVIVFSDKRCDGILSEVKPDIYVKGEDYTLDTLDQDERKAVEKNGGKIKFIPFVKGLSTTNLVKKIRRSDPEKIINGAFAMITDVDNRLLMVANDYEDGIKWGLPGGGQNRGETLEQTVVRETMEETGLEIEIVRYLGIIERIEPEWNLHLICHQFESEVIGGELLVRDNEEHVIEAVFKTEQEIRELTGHVLGREHLLAYLQNPQKYRNYIFMGTGEE